MTTVNAALQDLVYELQARRILHANWLAQQVRELYEEAWRRMLADLRSARRILRSTRVLAQAFVGRKLAEMAARVWFMSFDRSLRALPRPVVERVVMAKPVRENERIDGGETEKAEPIKRRDPPREYALPWAEALYRPPTPAEFLAAVYETRWVQTMARFGVGDETEIASIVSTGLLAGRTNVQIAADLQATVIRSRARAMRIARTEAHRVNVQQQEAGIRQVVGPLLKGWRYVATLDTRTRPHHAARDGQVYDTEDQRPVLPDGPNCRCVYSAVTKGYSELGVPELEDLMTPTERASMDGSVPAAETYESWFDRQSADRQREILGAGRFERLAGNSGKVRWSSFVAMPRSPARRRPVETVKG